MSMPNRLQTATSTLKPASQSPNLRSRLTFSLLLKILVDVSRLLIERYRTAGTSS